MLFDVLSERYWAKYFHKSLANPALEKPFTNNEGDLQIPLTCVIVCFFALPDKF